MRLFGVVNASPDSLHEGSIARTAEAATARGRWLLDEGCYGIDLGGQGSTHVATAVSAAEEWQRLAAVLPALADFGVPVSVDTWRPEVAQLALRGGATVLNAADGLQAPGMLEVAAAAGCPVVLPFLSGPNPLELVHVEGDPLDAMEAFFTEMLRRCDDHGVTDVWLDPGTGFAPLGWEWPSRFAYQQHVYTHLDRLRAFGKPLYVALPWRETSDHEHLLELVLDAEVDYGRVHHPDRVLAAAARRR
jgi:dihydropteroate synthase